MKSITRIYLASIIYIVIHRKNENDGWEDKWLGDYYFASTDETVLDFIISIPYFDNGLKDFIIGNLREQSIIITAGWEDEFIDKCFLWEESKQGLRGLAAVLNKAADNAEPGNLLKLPY